MNITKTIFLFLITLCSIGKSQDFPTIPAEGFSFPLGSKFTIQLFAIDSMNFNYSILEFEPFHEYLDSWNTDSLFSQEGQDSTLSFYFTYGTHGESEEEKKKNTRIFLIIKNYTDLNLDYTSDIQREEDGDYEITSNVGVYSKAISREFWPYYINFIGLKEFRKIE